MPRPEAGRPISAKSSRRVAVAERASDTSLWVESGLSAIRQCVASIPLAWADQCRTHLNNAAKHVAEAQ